ncbi:MAG TPA: catechol 1,2-dioxygenase [Pseudonocardia sp.]|uniref:catechol 1,2-dioxygenase n=1 Tax=Pseudonocardia sp. TaxID=60912 RepID=UPI002B8B9543|nr:catechol 1,2-dioxygenase [Pseudonocardia sp.]HTF49278.1 catechol 1,2-dioxygenase [Pseudonocardia sp.]
MTTTEHSPTAAGSGASASQVFRATHSATDTAGEVSAERVDDVARALLRAVHEVIREKNVTYSEFQAAKQWLMDVGEGGEWPLLLDVFVEHVIEDVAARTQNGSVGSIQGPYYLPEQRRVDSPATLPARPDEKGEPLVLAGRVVDLDGNGVGGAELDVWHADDQGYYSGFAPDIPEGNLRAVVVADEAGWFEINTVRPAPYQIPTDGPTGNLIAAAGWHAWRPAHLHLFVQAPGYRRITTQLYFAGGDWLDSDVAEATKPELVLDPQPGEDGRLHSTYDFVLEPAS